MGSCGIGVGAMTISGSGTGVVDRERSEVGVEMGGVCGMGVIEGAGLVGGCGAGRRGVGLRGVVGRGGGLAMGAGVAEDIETVVGGVWASRPWISGKGNTKWPSEVTSTGVLGVV